MKQKVKCSKCRSGMRNWALSWKRGEFPDGTKLTEDQLSLCIRTAKSFRDGPCFHEEIALENAQRAYQRAVINGDSNPDEAAEKAYLDI